METTIYATGETAFVEFFVTDLDGFLLEVEDVYFEVMTSRLIPQAQTTPFMSIPFRSALLLCDPSLDFTDLSDTVILVSRTKMCEVDDGIWIGKFEVPCDDKSVRMFPGLVYYGIYTANVPQAIGSPLKVTAMEAFRFIDYCCNKCCGKSSCECDCNAATSDANRQYPACH